MVETTRDLQTESVSCQKEMCETNYIVESTMEPFEGNPCLINTGPNGGDYRAGSTAIFVPAGACLTSQEIRLQLIFENEPMTTLNVDKQEVFPFSGILVLEPHELQFQVPIELRFPFTAVQQGWVMLLLREEPGKGWETAFAFDGDTRQVIEQDSHCDYEFDTATLKLSHFCKYRWCGYKKENCSSSEKVLHCMLFARMNSSGDSCDFVLHFCDNCEDVDKKVKQTEKSDRSPSFNFADSDNIPISLEGNINIQMISNDFKVEDSSEICISSRELFPKQYCGTLKKVDFCGNLAAKLPTLKRDPKLTVKVTASDKSVTLKAIIDRGPQISEDRISQQSDWSIPSSGRGSMTASQGFSDSDTASLSQTSSKSSLQSFQAQGLLSARESDVAMIAIPSGGRSATSSSRTSADSGYSHERTASLPDLSRREKLESQALAFLGQNEEMNEFNSSQLFIQLSKNLGHEWKLFARSLGLTTAAIENIEADNPSQRERSYQVCIQWTRRGTASRTALYNAIMAVDSSGALMERLIADQ